MPSRGLPTVEQKFIADVSQYTGGMQQIIGIHADVNSAIAATIVMAREMAPSFALIKAAGEDMKTVLGGAGDAAGSLREKFADLRSSVGDLREVREAVAAVSSAIGDAGQVADDSGSRVAAYAGEYARLSEAVAGATAVHEQHQLVLARTGDLMNDSITAIGDMADASASSAGRISDAYDNLGASTAAASRIAISSLSDQGSALDMILVKMNAIQAKAPEVMRVFALAGGGAGGGGSGFALGGGNWDDAISELENVISSGGTGGFGGSGGRTGGGGSGNGGGNAGSGGLSGDDFEEQRRNLAAMEAAWTEAATRNETYNNALINSGNRSKASAQEVANAWERMNETFFPSESAAYRLAAAQRDVAAATKEISDQSLITGAAVATEMGKATAAVTRTQQAIANAVIYSSVATAATTAGGAGGGWNSGAAAAAATAAAAQARRVVQGSGGSSLTTALAAAAGGSGVGGAGGAAAAMFGGGGGGGSGFGLGTSGVQSAAMLSWLGTWYPRFHYAMMATNEILATVGPAAIAAGNAMAVGAQGGQTLWNRLVAVNDVSQSLGAGALNETSGQFLGLGDALQKAQNSADTGVWELMGAGINSVKAASDNAAGGLSNFWSMGQNTIDMLDRFSAGMTLDFKGGAGKALAGVVSGGVGDLQQFGQVFGNLGKTFMNVAPNLPGVGSDILSTLDAFTKGLSLTTGWLGEAGLLGPALAAEAGGRYGPALVGSVGRGIGALGGLAGNALEGIGSGLSAFGLAGAGVLGTAAGDATAGTGIRGFFGAVAHPATAAEAASLGIAEGDMVAGTGAAGFLGSLSAPEIALAAAGAYITGRAIMQPTPAQAATGSLQTQINQAPFLQGGSELVNAMNQTAVAAQAAPGANWNWDATTIQNLKGLVSGGARGTDLGSLMNFATQYSNFLGAGAQVQQDLGGQLGGVSLSGAYGLLDQAGVQMSTAFGKNGTLTPVALQQVLNAATGYQMMHANTGQFGVNVGAVTAAQGLGGTLASVNTSQDLLLQNATEGTTAITGLYQSLQAAQTLGAGMSVPPAKPQTATAKAAAEHTAEEAKVSSKKDQENFAKALTSFTTPQGASAWAALSSTSTTTPGLIQQAGTMMDWLRTAATSYGWGGQPGITATQMEGAGGYLAKQLLPYGKQSPAALAEISTIAQQAGLGSQAAYNPTLTQAQNYKNISKAIDKVASSQKEYNATVTDGTKATSDLSAQAQGFSSAVGSSLSTALSGADPSVTRSAAAYGLFAGSLKRGSGTFDKAALTGLAQNMRDTGQNLASIQAVVSQTMTRYGATSASIKAATGDVGDIISGRSLASLTPHDTTSTSPLGPKEGKLATLVPSKLTEDAAAALGTRPIFPGPTAAGTAQTQAAIADVSPKTIRLSVQADTSGINKVKSDIAGISGKDIKLAVSADTSGATRAKNAVQSVADKTVRLLIQANTAGAIAAQAALNAVQNKTVTVNLRYVTSGPGGAMPGASGPVAGHVLAEQTGGKIPGYGGGDIIPAMLEPGEAVVPKHLVGMVAPLLAGRVPGFAAGGVAPGVGAMMQAVTGANSAAQIAGALGSAPVETAASLITSQMAYISGTYGTPGNAMAHKLQFGWFDAGGMLMPGLTMAYNGTGSPEVITPMTAGGGPTGGAGASQPNPPLSAALLQLEAQLEAAIEKSGIGKKIAVSLVSGISSGLADADGTKGIASLASSLVTRIKNEVSYAKTTSANVVSGLGFAQLDPSNGGIADQMQSYLTSIQQFTTAISELSKGGLNQTLLKQLASAGPAALPEAQAILGQGSASAASASAVSGLNFAQIDPTQGPVAQQMGTYTSSLKQFTKDVGALGKDHLNKSLLNQLIQAGPSSDPLAQSLLGAGSTGGNQVAAVNAAYASLQKAANQFGTKANQAQGGGKGEIAAINKLYGAITKAANVFGAKAAGAAYGGVLAPNLKSGTFTTNNVTVSVNMGSGSGSGNLALSNAQMKQLIAEIEAKILQQSKRNRKSGLTQKGYGS
jgi:hypothetical protein